jgi:hypothetical protein
MPQIGYNFRFGLPPADHYPDAGELYSKLLPRKVEVVNNSFVQLDDTMLRQSEEAILAAGRAIKENRLCRTKRCDGCDFQGICRSDFDAANCR